MNDARFRTLAVGVAVVAALGTLSACGGHGGDKAGGSSNGGNAPATDALTALRMAATKTDRASSAKVNGTTDASGVTTTMAGALDWSNGLTGNVNIAMSGGQVGAAMKQMGSTGSYQARYLTDAMYMDMGAAIAKTDGGKPWVKYDYNTLAKMLGASGAALKQEFQNNNPTLSVKMLIASGSVKAIGAETVNGTRTTHYAGTVEVAKLLGAQSGMDAASTKALKTQLQAEGLTTDHIDVWVDGSGLLVKKLEKAAMNSGTLTSTASYSDYGVKVSVTPPPAGQTEDVSKMLAAQGQG